MEEIVTETYKQIRTRLFALSCGLLILSVVMSLSKETLWIWSVPFAVIIFLYAVIAPLKLTVVVRMMDKLHIQIGKGLFWILFFIFITPLSWLLRLIRPGLIPLKIDDRAPSYWTTSEKDAVTPDDLKKQF
ncbi:hypothetical protein [Vibrio mangrovi]|uniref:SxtJ n=1 Tax=Vibrio mangrovi TaxID=474394 RepID=A0A1Y6IQN4_9VIBR|nr:hypothetical protein [Vibrio mangrovi]MDW6003267.1 hypothetical protein [Vibrio mangrovi]SMR99945.1 hypothetical protein VIM7927_01183 [Vibrio mangrovi]